MKIPRSTVEQWATLQTVIDEGSFAKAAEKLHRSQSTISYTVNTLQEQLGVEILVMQGRRAVLTPMGEILLNRSREITQLLGEMERSVVDVQQGYESHLSLVVDALCARESIMPAIQQFESMNHQTKLDLRFEILSGPILALQKGTADIVITPHVPKGFLGENFGSVQIQPFAHINSPLHHLTHRITERDLKTQRYITISDKFEEEARSDGWFGSEYTWRVDSFDTAKALLLSGVGFAWLPVSLTDDCQDLLKPLNLVTGGLRTYPLFLVQRNLELIGPARKLLVELLTGL
jgi:DNA-binding transcriptional LysR family regulator